MPSREEIYDVLVRARELISNPKAWTQDGLYAMDANGYDVPKNSKDAVCFCMIGAVGKASNTDRFPFDYVRPIGAALDRPKFMDIVSFNDAPETTHADVLAVFDKAIASVSE